MMISQQVIGGGNDGDGDDDDDDDDDVVLCLSRRPQPQKSRLFAFEIVFRRQVHTKKDKKRKNRR